MRTMALFAIGLVLCGAPRSAGAFLDSEVEVRDDHRGQISKPRERPTPPIDMRQFMAFSQGEDGRFHLEGTNMIYSDGQEARSELGAFLKSYWCNRYEFVVLKSRRGFPIEQFSDRDGFIFIDFEAMDWVHNKEWREHRLGGASTLPWIWGRARPGRVLWKESADYWWRYCDNPRGDEYVEFDSSMSYVTRVINLAQEPVEVVAGELDDPDPIDPAWQAFAERLGFADAEVGMVAVVNYWGDLGAPSDYEGFGERSENEWRYREVYKYLAVMREGKPVFGIGLVEWSFYVHERAEDPFNMTQRVRMNTLVEEDVPITAVFPCE